MLFGSCNEMWLKRYEKCKDFVATSSSISSGSTPVDKSTEEAIAHAGAIGG
jgi:hypothetical protein